jgi:hypothetical protein
MYNFGTKYSFGLPNAFDSSKGFQNIQIGIVKTVGKVNVSGGSDKIKNKDARFNADEHAIRCRIIGSNFDNTILDNELPNCFPLLPKHLNLVPKENEAVLIFTFSEDDKFSDRFYIGPITSSLTKLNNDTIDTTALSNFGIGLTRPYPEIDKIPTARGIYDNPQNVIIDGRYNTDVIQRENEVLIRSGKFYNNEPLKFNQTNPAYIQLKFNQTIIDKDTNIEKTISVSNIVANKINLLTYKDGSPEFDNLTSVNKDTGIAEYISDEQMAIILSEAHPLVFGDKLVEYLRLFRNALSNHVHNGNGNKPTDRTDGGGTLPLEDFIKAAERLEKEMLSSNIRIN